MLTSSQHPASSLPWRQRGLSTKKSWRDGTVSGRGLREPPTSPRNSGLFRGLLERLEIDVDQLIDLRKNRGIARAYKLQLGKLRSVWRLERAAPVVADRSAQAAEQGRRSGLVSIRQRRITAQQLLRVLQSVGHDSRTMLKSCISCRGFINCALEQRHACECFTHDLIESKH